MVGRIPGCFPECVFYCSNSPRGSEKPEIGPHAALPLFFILSQVRSQKLDFCHNIGWFCYCGQVGGHMGAPLQWDGRSVHRCASPCRLQSMLSPVRPDEGIGPYGQGGGLPPPCRNTSQRKIPLGPLSDKREKNSVPHGCVRGAGIITQGFTACS